MQKNSDKTFLDTLQLIINIFHYFIIIIDEDHNILLANDAVLNSLKKDINDIRGCFCPTVIHGIDSPFPGCPLEEALKSGNYVEKEILDPFYKKWVSSAIYPINYKTKDGKKLFFHIAIDISRRKEFENTIVKQYDFMKNIIESLTHPFYIINVHDYTITMANAAAGFGTLTKDSKCYELTHNTTKPCDSSKHNCTIDKILKTRKPVVVEHEHNLKGGKKRYYEIHGYPIFDQNGEITQIIEYSVDITSRKQREQKIIQYQKELVAKSKNLEKKNIALEVLLDHQSKGKKKIYKSILDDIKILVNPYIEQLRSSSLNESQSNLLNTLESNLANVVKPFTKPLMDDSVNLSPAEVRVAYMIMDGKIAKEIGEVMNISENTVKTYFRNIRSKLKIRNKKINLRSYLQSLDKLAAYKKL
ncbi:PAS domain-containing protein [Candidatus Latescibacterota bacterium]